MPNIQPRITIPLFGMLQELDYRVIDQHWEVVVELVKNDVQPNIYGMVLYLYGAGDLAPLRPPKREVSVSFSHMWVGKPKPDGEPLGLEVKRTAAQGVGWVYYDVVQAGTNGSDNGRPSYEYAIERWQKKFGPDCAREQTLLERWLQNATR